MGALNAPYRIKECVLVIDIIDKSFRSLLDLFVGVVDGRFS